MEYQAIKIVFTANEREVLLHRLASDGIVDCLASTEAERQAPQGDDAAFDALYGPAYERLDVVRADLERRLEANLTMIINTPDEYDLILDSFEGSTWWANIDREEGLARARGIAAHQRLHDKFVKAFVPYWRRDVEGPLD